MPVDYIKMDEELDAAYGHLDNAIQGFAHIDRMTPVDSSIMGHIRCLQAGLSATRDFVQQCKAFREAKASDKKPQRQPAITK